MQYFSSYFGCSVFSASANINDNPCVFYNLGRPDETRRFSCNFEAMQTCKLSLHVIVTKVIELLTKCQQGTTKTEG